VAGNAVSLAVLLGRAFRKSSLSFTLGALAVIDTAVLCTVLPRQWIMFLTDDEVDIRSLTGAVGCKLHFFLTYYLSPVLPVLPVSVICSPTTSLICFLSFI